MGCILLAALILFLVYRVIYKAPGAYVQITVEDKVTDVVPLGKNMELDIPSSIGTNHLIIKDGVADMTSADCLDKTCVNHRPISKNGESIICLPARIVVTIISNDSPDLDSISE